MRKSTIFSQIILTVAGCSVFGASTPASRIFKGAINDRYTVTLTLQFWNGHVAGAYYYGSKTGSLLPLYGRTFGDSAIIQEYVAELNGTFSCCFNSDTTRLAGVWKNSASTKRFQFAVAYEKDTLVAPPAFEGTYAYSAGVKNSGGEVYSMTQYAFAASIKKNSGTGYRCTLRRSGLGAMEGEVFEDTLKRVMIDYRVITGTVNEEAIVGSFGTGPIVMVLLPTGDLLVNGLVFRRGR